MLNFLNRQAQTAEVAICATSKLSGRASIGPLLTIESSTQSAVNNSTFAAVGLTGTAIGSNMPLSEKSNQQRKAGAGALSMKALSANNAAATVVPIKVFTVDF